MGCLGSCGGSSGPTGSESSGFTVPENPIGFESYYANLVCPHILGCWLETIPEWSNVQCHDAVVSGIGKFWMNTFSVPRSYNRAAAQRCVDLTLN